MHICFIKKTFQILIKIKVKYQLEETIQQITTAINIDQLQILSIIICLWKTIKPLQIVNGNRQEAIKNGQFKDAGNIGYTTQHEDKKKKKKKKDKKRQNKKTISGAQFFFYTRFPPPKTGVYPDTREV